MLTLSFIHSISGNMLKDAIVFSYTNGDLHPPRSTALASQNTWIKDIVKLIPSPGIDGQKHSEREDPIKDMHIVAAVDCDIEG